MNSLIEEMARAGYEDGLDARFTFDNTGCDIREEWRSSMRAALNAADEAGYVLTPREPTQDMHDAARDWSLSKYGQAIGRDASRGCYLSMLSALPKINVVS